MRFGLLVLLLSICPLGAGEVRQLVIGISQNWEANTGKLQRFEQRSGGGWERVGAPIQVLFGRNGLAWGRGLHEHQSGIQKQERDKRAPAGMFKIGKIYTPDAQLPEGASYPFLQIGPGDAWIDDPASPLYNQHVRVDPRTPPAWFEKQKMRPHDPAYRWLVEIRHNAEKPMPRAGSAIFFHIRRGPTRPSAGCTTMAEGDLVELIRWLRADADPVYVLLPAEEYRRKWKAWGLPEPGGVAALLGK